MQMRHKLTKSLRPNHRPIEHFPSHLTTMLLRLIYSSSFCLLHDIWVSWINCKAYQKVKNTVWEGRASIRTRHGRMLELSNGEFKIKMINRLRALIDKVDSMQEKNGQCKQRDRNARKEKEGKVGKEEVYRYWFNNNFQCYHKVKLLFLHSRW